MKTHILITLSTVLLVGASSCKKYNEGPAISLVPKQERVANTWVVQKAFEDGQDVSDQYDQYELYLTSDGDAQLTAKYKAFGVNYTTETNGTWTFQNEKQEIMFDYEDDDQDGTYQILRLTQDEFWLRKIGSDLELRLIQK